MTQPVVMQPMTTQNAPNPTLGARVATNVRAHMAAQRKTTTELAVVLRRDVRAAQRRCSGEQEFSLGEVEAVALWLDLPVSALMAQLRAVA